MLLVQQELCGTTHGFKRLLLALEQRHLPESMYPDLEATQSMKRLNLGHTLPRSSGIPQFKAQFKCRRLRSSRLHNLSSRERVGAVGRRAPPLVAARHDPPAGGRET